ncbi:Vitamin B12 ABC transporter, substrate-binding protein BtuF [hydrothermal vent metagenome]|uniref:Vitamin B12 ABC transporter, substrate-binding protein BtuF n=1 Tax=hydrothermal vent metagenome TaxID=652676 RepID=A0A3B0UB98_9ZZZZ
MNKTLFLIFIAASLFRCSPKSTVEEKPLAQEQLEYATGFTISQKENYTLVTINTPYKNAESGLRYVLYPRNEAKPVVEADAYIPVPLKSIVCTSTTHIPLLDYLNETDKLVGFPTTDYISSKPMRARIDEGKVIELGIDNALNIEKLIELNPELVMAYTMTSDFGQFNKIQEAGIPVLINAEYLETDPLGRAEWIKLAGLLFGKEEAADSVFTMISKEYKSTLAKVESVETKPTVMSGSMYSDTWYMPGGRNYAGKLLTDAGLNYLWKEDTTTSFLTLSYEVVLEKASKADFWIGASNFKTLAEMKDANERYRYFTPFKTRNVYSYNKRIGAKGGSEFLELGYLRPDFILKDLVKIGHPEVLPNHELFFYFQLPEK